MTVAYLLAPRSWETPSWGSSLLRGSATTGGPATSPSRLPTEFSEVLDTHLQLEGPEVLDTHLQLESFKLQNLDHLQSLDSRWLEIGPAWLEIGQPSISPAIDLALARTERSIGVPRSEMVRITMSTTEQRRRKRSDDAVLLHQAIQPPSRLQSADPRLTESRCM
jgi:hypothetical protein